MNYSGIQSLPDTIRKLQSLRFLNLRNCISLKELPDSLFELKNLRRLNLFGTPVQVSEANLDKLPNLDKKTLTSEYL